MPPLELFDANCRLGSSEFTAGAAPTTAAALLAEMDRVGIAEALLYHASAAAYAPAFGNALLTPAPRLHPCWVLMPHHTGEIDPPPALVTKLLASGARAARLLPRLHRYPLSSIHPLLARLEAHRIPLFFDFGRAHWADQVVDYDQLSGICAAFPRLPVILVREGIGSARYLYPLLERHDNLAIEISYYQVAQGLADITRRFGAHHLLFGTGLPEYAAGPAITMLLHAEISDDDRTLIAHANLRRLLGGVSIEEA